MLTSNPYRPSSEKDFFLLILSKTQLMRSYSTLTYFDFKRERDYEKSEVEEITSVLHQSHVYNNYPLQLVQKGYFI